MVEESLKRARRRVVGSKQTYRAVEKGEAVTVFVAEDADAKVTAPLIQLCRDKGIPWHYAGRMSELGKSCGIKVGAASAAIIE